MLWIGTLDGGLNKLDREKEKFTHYQHDPKNPNSLSGKGVISIYEDRSGVLWIGTGSWGLNKFDREKETFTRYQHDPNNPNSLSHNFVWSIYEDRSEMLWIGTAGGGVNKFDREKKKFTHYKNNPNNPNSLNDNTVWSIYEDRSGMLWIGTAGGGLNKFDRAKGRMTHYRENDGLPDDCIYGILEDDHGNLWLSTNNGLSKFNHQTQVFKNYDVGDGLQSKEYNTNAYYKSAVSGEMFFGGINGFNAFHPDSLKDNPDIPPVVITALARYNTDDVAGKPIAEKGIAEASEIELSYKDNILTFEFAALNYRNTFKNQYAYKLEGFNDNWIQLGAKRDVTFTNLDPGEYTLRVKGSNNDGVWNEEGTSLQITITPPWWRTRWAYSIYALLVLAGVFATDRIQRRRLIKREYDRAQMREGKLRAEAAEAKASALQAENERKKNVELLSEIGKEITASLDMDTIFYKLYEHVNQLAEATVFGVGIYHPQKEQIEYRLAFEKGKRYAPYSRDTRDKNQFPVWCIENRMPVFINDVTQEYGRYLKAFKSANVEGMRLEDGTLPEEPFSIIYLPLLSQERVLGVITIQSFQKNAYTNYHLNLLQSLATYTTIALDNADAYRRLDATLQNLKSTQQQLITQEKLASLGQLTAGIAHEIKNPLNFVNNFAVLSVDLAKELREEIAKIEDSGSKIVDRESIANIKEILETLEQNAEKINHHGKRADGIVKSMMQHARGSSGQRELTDINHLLDEAVNLTYHGMRANDASFNITIEKEYDATIGKLEVVPQDLSRVFLNVVNNACYAAHQKKRNTPLTPLKGGIVVESSYDSVLVNESPLEGGQGGVIQNAFSPTLSVITKNLGDKIEIRIRDNGNGIPQDVREKIFNPFFTTKPTGQGTGLGLSISYDIIVQQHRGEIKLETEAGKFTEFIIQLPQT